MIDNFHRNDTRYPHPVLTAQDEFNFQSSTHCAYCNIEYSTIPNSMKHRHHDHHKAPIYAAGIRLPSGKMSYPLKEGNYVNSSCALCNWKITNKRNTVNVYFHNFSNYDGPLLIQGLIESKQHDMECFTILPKGPTGYNFIQYN